MAESSSSSNVNFSPPEPSKNMNIRSMLWDLVDGYRPSDSGSISRHSSVPSRPRQQRDADASPQRQALRRTAQETLDVLPRLLNHLNTSYQAHQSKKVSFRSLRRLEPSDCPRFPSPATIKVINDDTLNVAVRLFQSTRNDRPVPNTENLRPIIINFASHRKPGGGWQNGAMAQEESLCYRSSLALSLHRMDYPLALDEAIYSPYVLVMRSDLASGHALLTPPSTPPEELPVVSGITIAALYRPILRTLAPKGSPKRSYVQKAHPGPHRRSASAPPSASSSSPLPPRRQMRQVFARDKDRNLTKSKMRLALRMAATNGHGMLVLGALGCGVYANPPVEVAECWLEVLKEAEFAGNWWREVCFAVYDPKNEGNFATFDRILAGRKV